ncbi:hypothetical protein GY45DRAFT_1064010 [Cubamyces sp. BRFM 1775]|nr:hypothetical protein GY45DRAFT_1064010 [Cubamyces sp. BRFM 1775]
MSACVETSYQSLICAHLPGLPSSHPDNPSSRVWGTVAPLCECLLHRCSRRHPRPRLPHPTTPRRVLEHARVAGLISVSLSGSVSRSQRRRQIVASTVLRSPGTTSRRVQHAHGCAERERVARAVTRLSCDRHPI